MRFFSLLYLILISLLTHAQCPGFNNGRNLGASTNVIVAGSTPWEVTYPSSQSSDNVYTYMRIGTVLTSHYLIAYNWGYSFSTGTICGIKVRVEKSAPATNPGTVTDLEAKLYNGSAYSPNNYADVVTPWPGTDTYFTYGGNSDLWGWGSITIAQINSVGFGFRFRAQRTNVNDSAKIDHIEMTAHSDELLPVELLSFDAIKNIQNKSVLLKWKCASETNNNFFTIERSRDFLKWEVVKTIQGAGNSSLETYYETTDEEPFPGESYYYLKQTDFDGTTKILDVISIRFKNHLDNVMLYPTMATETINIKSKTNINHSQITISDPTGRTIKEAPINSEEETYEYAVDIAELPPGIYLVKISNDDFSIVKKFIKD